MAPSFESAVASVLESAASASTNAEAATSAARRLARAASAGSSTSSRRRAAALSAGAALGAVAAAAGAEATATILAGSIGGPHTLLRLDTTARCKSTSVPLLTPSGAAPVSVSGRSMVRRSSATSCVSVAPIQSQPVSSRRPRSRPCSAQSGRFSEAELQAFGGRGFGRWSRVANSANRAQACLREAIEYQQAAAEQQQVRGNPGDLLDAVKHTLEREASECTASTTGSCPVSQSTSPSGSSSPLGSQRNRCQHREGVPACDVIPPLLLTDDAAEAVVDHEVPDRPDPDKVKMIVQRLYPAVPTPMRCDPDTACRPSVPKPYHSEAGQQVHRSDLKECWCAGSELSLDEAPRAQDVLSRLRGELLKRFNSLHDAMGWLDNSARREQSLGVRAFKNALFRLGIQDDYHSIFSAVDSNQSSSTNLPEFRRMLLEGASEEELLWELRCRLKAMNLRPFSDRKAALALIQQPLPEQRHKPWEEELVRSWIEDDRESSEVERLEDFAVELNRSEWLKFCTALGLTLLEGSRLFDALVDKKSGAPLAFRKLLLPNMFEKLRSTVSPDISLERFAVRLFERFGTAQNAFRAVCPPPKLSVGCRVMDWPEFQKLSHAIDVNDRCAERFWELLSVGPGTREAPVQVNSDHIICSPRVRDMESSGRVLPRVCRSCGIGEDVFVLQLSTWAPSSDTDMLRDQLCDRFGSLDGGERAFYQKVDFRLATEISSASLSAGLKVLGIQGCNASRIIGSLVGLKKALRRSGSAPALAPVSAAKPSVQRRTRANLGDLFSAMRKGGMCAVSGQCPWRSPAARRRSQCAPGLADCNATEPAGAPMLLSRLETVAPRPRSRSQATSSRCGGRYVR